jgi:hypothetical protein
LHQAKESTLQLFLVNTFGGQSTDLLVKMKLLLQALKSLSGGIDLSSLIFSASRKRMVCIVIIFLFGKEINYYLKQSIMLYSIRIQFLVLSILS